jgi:hypothetical protein
MKQEIFKVKYESYTVVAYQDSCPITYPDSEKELYESMLAIYEDKNLVFNLIKNAKHDVARITNYDNYIRILDKSYQEKIK